jgi:hypothetical protein
MCFGGREMSDTPETDEQFKSFPAYFEIDLFCRKLERERDEAKRLQDYDTAKAIRREKERDEAIREMNRYKRQWEESRSENVEGAK